MSTAIKHKLNHLEENSYEATVSGAEAAEEFLAPVSNNLPEGESERQIVFQIMTAHGVPQDKCEVSSGSYTKGEGEKSVKISIIDAEGNEVNSAVENYD